MLLTCDTDTELKEKIQAWLAERRAAKMDVSTK
jgi:hypothetical protein